MLSFRNEYQRPKGEHARSIERIAARKVGHGHIAAGPLVNQPVFAVLFARVDRYGRIDEVDYCAIVALGCTLDDQLISIFLQMILRFRRIDFFGQVHVKSHVPVTRVGRICLETIQNNLLIGRALPAGNSGGAHINGAAGHRDGIGRAESISKAGSI